MHDDRRRSTRLGAGALAAAVVAGSLVLAVPADAGRVAAVPRAAGDTSAAFTFTGGNQSWVVPAGVDSIAYVVEGAGGGAGRAAVGAAALAGGSGARVMGGLQVTPGETLTIVVGGAGAPGSAAAGGAGGFGGGAAGGAQGGGGGGGASSIRRGASSLVVAGGGGGAGASGDVKYGGNGGADDSDGQPGSECTGQNISGEGGTRATGGGGGAGGAGALPGTLLAAIAGGTGSAAQGGTGGNGYNPNGAGTQAGGGGGGGGGVYGGGGGGGGTVITVAGCGSVGSGGGGGGGSSLVVPGTVVGHGRIPGNGRVTIYPGPWAPLFISEHVTNGTYPTATVAVELYNPTPSPVTLTDRYRLVVDGNVVLLSGTVAGGDVFVAAVGANASVFPAVDQAVYSFTLAASGAVSLFGGATLLDSVNPPATLGADLCTATHRRRQATNSGFTGGTAFVCSDQYDAFPAGTFDGLGSHLPPLTVGDAAAVEGTGAGGTLHLPVTLPRPSPLTVSASWSTAPGSATAADVTASSGTVTFAPGETSTTVDVPVVGDHEHEATEQLTVTLANPVNAVIGHGTGTATIQDDDPLPVVTAGPDSAATAAGVPVDLDVRANDTASVGPLSTPEVLSGPAHGTAGIVAGTVRYAPAPGFSGTDQLTYRVCSTWTTSVCATATATVTIAGEVVGMVPLRLLDSRPGEATGDGQFAGIGQLAAGSTLELPVAGRGAVPPDATAVVLNVTATQVAGPGFVTVWPCGADRPLASNLNVVAGQTVPNAVVAKVGAGGKVCLFTLSATHLIVDANAWFPAASAYEPVVPARLLDSRQDEATIDRSFAGIGQRPAGSTTELVVAGRGPVPADAGAVVLNVTATNVAGPGFVTVWPCGSDRPLASNLNVVPGQTVPNLVTAKVGVGGKVCLFTQSPLDLVADVNGVFPASADFRSIVPARLMDTRPGEATVDGRFAGSGLRAAGSVTALAVGGRDQVPANASTVVLNVTATDARGAGFVTVWPCGTDRPLASNLNVVAGQTVPNAVVARVGPGSTVCLFTSTDTHLIVDVTGYFT